jgi:hypothetical protein
MAMDDYRDPYYEGLNDVLDDFEKKLYLYRVTGKTISADGSVLETKRRYSIYGSLQTWRRKRKYNEDSTITSSREGKLLVKYKYKLNDGDIVQKENNFYRVIDTNDFDFAQVHDYPVERLGYDEIQEYKFEEYLDEEFPEIV